MMIAQRIIPKLAGGFPYTLLKGQDGTNVKFLCFVILLGCIN